MGRRGGAKAGTEDLVFDVTGNGKPDGVFSQVLVKVGGKVSDTGDSIHVSVDGSVNEGWTHSVFEQLVDKGTIVSEQEFQEGVPLALPKTGDTSIPIALLAAAQVDSATRILLLRRRREEEE